jgi:hypothetical protein
VIMHHGGCESTLVGALGFYFSRTSQSPRF